jgi:hypothetical protein
VRAIENTVLHQSLDQAEFRAPFPRGIRKGQQFARLTVIRRATSNSTGKARILCRCTCGNERVVQAADLKGGHTKSCGCLRAVRGRHMNVERQFIQFGTVRALGRTELVQEIGPSTLWVTFCSYCYAFGIATASQLRLGEQCPCRNSKEVDTLSDGRPR